ncbi:C6 zinc finger domain protein [Cordyceps militaris CM01]|uniref:C6 zinc finger domain protein n=1 Tax=Cordyceps militaris (strain CM01) TaxID=983644 RepID=G3JRX7_CORMM|nr:C6 zinc finger domain protein [Cordyceps militaris CM01]EGX88623.1 C6 zinc finger domain protein [Cordyceps militaris CM01]
MACRRRKIKCNREQPCQHCTETHQACHYQAPPSPQLWQAAEQQQQQQQQQQQPRSNNWRSVIFSSGSNTPDSFADGSSAQQETTAALPPAALQSPPASQPTQATVDADRIVLDKTRILRWSHWMGAGQEFGPIFSCYLATLAPRQEDSDLSPAAKTVLADAAEVLQKCKRLARSSKIWRPSRLFGMQGYDLILPSRQVADAMATEYFTYYESTIRILHIPSFWKLYDGFWKSESTATMETRLMILLVISIGTSLQDRSETSPAIPSIAQIHQWIYAAQTWLAGPLEKDRLDTGGLQIYCLLIVARQIYSVGGDLVWMSLGSLLHRAMQLGLHYDPKHFQGMSVLKSELRRRLWISPEEYDTEPPSNINDSDLDENTQALHPKPESECTDTTLQRHLVYALPARIRIVRYLNGIKADLSYPEAMSLSAGLSTAQRRATLALQSYPDQISPFQRNMVDFLLRRFVVPLHSPFACEARTTLAFHYSLKACTEASLALINPEPDARFARLLDSAGGLFREGLRSANTAISLDLIVQTKTQQADGTLHRTRTVRDALKRSVVDMLERCEKRISNGETNVKSYVFLAMVLAMTEAMENGEPCEMKIAQSARDALAHCYGVLESSLGSFVTNTPTDAGFPAGGASQGNSNSKKVVESGAVAFQYRLVTLASPIQFLLHPSSMKVLISGAGISGTALAFLLSKLHYDITVVERSPSLRVNGLQIDLRGYGIEVLRLMGLDAAFKEKAAPEQGMQVVDSAGTRLAYFAANTFDTGEQNCTSEYEIMRGDLCRLLHDASLAGGGRVRYIFDSSIKDLRDTPDAGGVTVTFSDNHTEMFDLVVGADGQWSRTRRLMLGTNTSPDPALRLLPNLHAGYFTMPQPLRAGEGFDATLYLASRRRSVVTRRTDPRFLQVYMACTSSALQTVRRGDVVREKEAFAASHAGAGWRMPELVAGLRAADDFYCERIGLVKLEAWHKGRVVLVGDAAYCPSALTGMGPTCGVVGAYVLAGELSRLGAGEEVDGGPGHSTLQDALAAYDARFRPFMHQVQDGVGEGSILSRMMSSSSVGIALTNYCLRAATFFGIRLSSDSFMKERVQNWHVPRYEALVGKE